MMKWLKRLGAGAALLIVLLLAAGVVYEQLARANATRLYPPPGKLVDIGGRRIQIDCRGTGSPTVVFESGLDSLGSLSWSAVHDEIAKITRACAYSRAGVMWSDHSDRPFSAVNVADDLHNTLVVAGEKPPYLLVVHSLGGPYALTFIGSYGADVAGLVFVDASHPDQIARLRAATGKTLDIGAQLRMGDALAWTGIVRLFIAANSPHAPPQIIGAVRAFLPTTLHAMLAESDALGATLATAGQTRKLGDRPLVVLTHGAKMTPAILRAQGLTEAQGARVDAAWLSLQNDEATWSTRSQHEIVPDASHYIQFDRPDVVIAATREVVAAVRAQTR